MTYFVLSRFYFIQYSNNWFRHYFRHYYHLSAYLIILSFNQSKHYSRHYLSLSSFCLLNTYLNIEILYVILVIIIVFLLRFTSISDYLTLNRCLSHHHLHRQICLIQFRNIKYVILSKLNCLIYFICLSYHHLHSLFIYNI